MIEKKGGAEGKAGYYYLIQSAFFLLGLFYRQLTV